MKKLLLAAVLALTACSPALTALHNPAAAVGTLQGTANTLRVTAQGLSFANLDQADAVNVVLAVDGPSAVTGCAAPVDGVSVCKLGTIQPGVSVTLSYVGTIADANATWRTPAGKLRAIVLSH